MISFLFFYLTKSALFGLDLGYENIRIGMSTFHGIQVAGNEQSRKLSPSYMAIWDFYSPATSKPAGDHWSTEELKNLTWDFLERAKSHSIRFPKNAIKSFWPLLNKSVGLEHREALALTLRHLITTCDNGKNKPEDSQFAVAVEPTLSMYEKVALIEAFNLSGATLNYIIDTPYAAAHLFALEKSRQYVKQPKTVAFVDIGAHGSWIAVYNFDSASKAESNVKELSLVTTNDIGGFHIDKILADFLMKKFEEKTNKTSDNPRVYTRLYQEVKRAKESLSLNKDVSVFIEELIDDQDLSYHLTRDEFNSLMGDLNKTLEKLVRDTLEKVGKKKIHSVEAIGGTSRAPFIREILTREFGVEELSRTMNPDESVALGASYISAAKSSAMKFPLKIVAKTRPHTDIFLHINGEKILLFDNKSFTDKKVNLEYTCKDIASRELRLTSDDSDRPLIIFSFQDNETKNDSSIVNIQFTFNQLSIPNVSKVTIDDVPANITFFSPGWMYSDMKRYHSTVFMNSLQALHNDRSEAARVRNEFEVYLSEMRSKLENDKNYTSIFTENETKNLEEGIEEQFAWLDNFTDPLANSSIYKQHLDAFRLILKGPDDRWEQIEKVPKCLESLNSSLEKIKKFFYEEAPKEKPWLFTHFNDSMDNLEQNIKSYSQQYDEFVANFSAWNRTCEPPFRHNQVHVAEMILNFNYNNVLKKRKPAPTPSPTPMPESHVPENEEKNETTAEEGQQAQLSKDAGEGGSSDDDDSKENTQEQAKASSPEVEEEEGNREL